MATPPNEPWKPIPLHSKSRGYLSIYYSDDMSGLPVRWVTKPGDNKSDPNIETMTYGLFSTCSKSLRSGIVTRGAEYLLFGTSRNGTRVLSGYYHLRWYTEWKAGQRDYAIAADKLHFVEHPIPFKEVDKKCGTDISKPFRGTRLLSREHCKKIVALLEHAADATSGYLEEIDRLERFNLWYGGYRYIAWRQGVKFSWEHATNYLSNDSKSAVAVHNSTLSNRWQCIECNGEVINRALLKRCPSCGALGSLRPN